VVGCGPVPAPPDGPYAILFRELGTGEISNYTVRETGEVDVRLETVRGRTLFPQNVKFAEELSFWEQVLEKPPGEAPTRTLRGYGTARYSVDSDHAVLPMEGRRVTIERHGDRYTYAIDGVRPGPVARHREVLEAEFTDDFRVEPYLPTRPVRLNEVYAFNGRPLAASISKYSGIEFDLNRVEARGWLVAVYDHQGRRYGRVIADLRVPVTAVSVDGSRLGVRYGDNIILQTTFDICIDGTARAGTVRTVTHLTSTTDVPRLAVKVVAAGERIVTITPPAGRN
jgi:hypothetical protein